METPWNTILWQQLGATIDMLENALLACPDQLWTQRLWPDSSDHSMPTEFAQFWYLTFHTLFWLDLYLSGSREEDFVPQTPFVWTELDPPVSPERPYTKEELHTYLTTLRQKCHATLIELTDERASQTVEYPWIQRQGRAVSFLELQIYSMRHVQEHAAQLSLFLGQHAIPDEALDWVSRAQDKPGS